MQACRPSLLTFVLPHSFHMWLTYRELCQSSHHRVYSIYSPRPVNVLGAGLIPSGPVLGVNSARDISSDRPSMHATALCHGNFGGHLHPAPFHTYCSSIAKPTAPKYPLFSYGIGTIACAPRALEPGAPQALRSIVDLHPTPRGGSVSSQYRV